MPNDEFLTSCSNLFVENTTNTDAPAYSPPSGAGTAAALSLPDGDGATQEAVRLRLLGDDAELQGNYPLALELYAAALAASEADSDLQETAKIHGNTGIVYWNLADYTRALECYHTAVEIYEQIGNLSGIAMSIGNIGNVYRSIADYTRALEYYQNALALNEELGSISGVAINLGNIGNLYQSLSEYDEALRYYHRALAINEQQDNISGIAINLGNMGNIYWNLEDYEQALTYYRRALAINEETGSISGIAINLGNIGGVYYARSDYDKALEYYRKALVINEHLGSTEGIIINLAKMGVLYADKHFAGYDVLVAEEHLLKAAAVAEDIGALHNLYELHQTLAELYEQTGRTAEAYNHFKKYHTIEKDVQSKESRRQADIYAYQRQAAEYEKQAAVERARSQATDDILANILPPNIMERLLKGETKIADTHHSVSVLFVDIVGFTQLSAQLPASEITDILDIVFTRFDAVCKKHGVEKIKTIGDAYMAVCGAPVPCSNHAERIALAALEMLEDFPVEQRFSVPITLKFRIGVHSGAVVAGIIGKNKYSYDLWGDAVNTAARMESHGKPGKIHGSEAFIQMLADSAIAVQLHFVPRGSIDIKGKGAMETYFLERISYS